MDNYDRWLTTPPDEEPCTDCSECRGFIVPGSTILHWVDQKDLHNRDYLWEIVKAHVEEEEVCELLVDYLTDMGLINA